MLTAEEKALRRTGIGASEAPILAMCDGYGRTPLYLYLEKKGLVPDDGGSLAMRIGNFLEAGVLDLYASELGIDRKKIKSVRKRFDGSKPMFCTPDAVLYNSDSLINVQVKCVGSHMLRHWGRGSDESAVPDYVLAQVQWEMEVLDVDTTHVVALLGGTDMRVYTVERDRDVGAELKRRAEMFWSQHVVPSIPPPVDGTIAGELLIDHLFPKRPEDKPLPLALDSLPEEMSTAILVAAKRAAKCKRVMGEAEKVYEECKQIVQITLGEHSSVRGRDGEFQFTANTQFARGRIDWEAYARSLGGLDEDAEKFRPESKRQFRLNTAIKQPLDKDDAIEDFVAAMERQLERY